MGRQGDVIEHLLIGPGGVYTLTVHSHPTSTVVVDRHVVQVDGRATSYVRDARLEARRARSLLADAVGNQVVVRPVVVLETAGTLELAPTTMPDDVLVLDGSDVPGLFPRVPARLSSVTQMPAAGVPAAVSSTCVDRLLTARPPTRAAVGNPPNDPPRTVDCPPPTRVHYG